MRTVLIIGVESVVGANLAAHLSGQYSVCGLSLTSAVSLRDCEVWTKSEIESSEKLLANVKPDQIVHCGPAAQSCWVESGALPSEDDLVSSAGTWAELAAQTETPFTYLSSDAIFSGPWLFHEEDDSESHCESPEAAAVVAAEKTVLAECPQALILRTNAYGWSPTGEGWIEDLIEQLETHQTIASDCVRHATPILATDLAEILLRSWEEDLAGLYHVAGAERVNPTRFIRCLANLFDLPFPACHEYVTLTQRPTDFGRGETSLQTRKVRKALCVAMPTLVEGLERLLQQRENGYLEQFPSAVSSTKQPALTASNRVA